MKMNEIYEAPAVEMIRVVVEAGFQQSVGGDSGFGGSGEVEFPE